MFGFVLPAVAQRRKFELEAYMSLAQVRKIHRLFKTRPDGIPLEEFHNVYKVHD